jgi:GTP-dependent phosphoenolpyruvate carboxykinase
MQAFRYGARQSFLALKYQYYSNFLENLHIMDGSEAEDQRIKEQLVSKGILIPLKYDNCYLARTDPDVSHFLLFQHLNEYQFR